MHICVIGDGVAGLMAANLFAVRDYVSKVTHIGSSKIPSIGVGESTTLNFEGLHSMFDDDFDSFIRESNACVKTGVLYSNWSQKEFLHHFKTPVFYQKYNTTSKEYSNSLGNKNKNIYIHDLIANRLYHDAKQNKIPGFGSENFYLTSWHFDAGKYISYLKKLLQRDQKKVTVIDDIVIDCKFKENESIDFITLESHQNITADYYIICTGKSTESSNIFNIKYEDLSNVLLTDKALFYPKPYVDKKKEIHPYTIAKTMKNGWRWITPTWSRVGTGYVFSSKHITEEQAIEEFRQDIGDGSLVPNVVDFHPRYNQSTFNQNYMTLGMCNGFLEPLDAPGLSISCALTMLLDNAFIQKKYDNSSNSWLNKFTEELYNGWAAFILTQYKTCYRSDTQFWKDHRNVEFDYLSNLMKDLNNENDVQNLNNSTAIISSIKKDIIMMIQQTLASRNLQWETKTDMIPFKLNDDGYESILHYDFLNQICGD